MRPDVFRPVAIALCTLGLIGASPPASSAVVSGTIAGTMTSGSSDTLNLFGGGDLTGKSLSINYSFDITNMMAGNTAHYDDYTSTGLSGDINLTVTIGGISMTNNTHGGVIGGQAFTSDSNFNTVETYGGGADPFLRVDVFVLGLWASGVTIGAPFNLDASRTDQHVAAGTLSTWENLNFVGSSDAEAAPEPFSIALLGTGAAALCVARRRRKQPI